MKLCVVVPCYNEEKRLKKNEFVSFLKEHPEIDFLFVNDGSSDKTIDILQEIESLAPNARSRNLVSNVGKARAIQKGMVECLELEYDFVGYFDADCATPLNEIPRFLEKLKNSEKTQLVMGSRILRLGGEVDRKWYRHLLGRLFATVASMTLRLPVYDTQCGAKFFKASLAKKIIHEPLVSYWIFDVELLFRMKKIKSHQELKDSIYELPLNKWVDEAGSKLGPLDFLKAPLELFKIIMRYR